MVTRLEDSSDIHTSVDKILNIVVTFLLAVKSLEDCSDYHNSGENTGSCSDLYSSKKPNSNFYSCGDKPIRR